MSFAAIQQAQQEQGAPVRDKRSLKEIQEEERDLQAEADFLVWWTAEEERLRLEAEAMAHRGTAMSRRLLCRTNSHHIATILHLGQG